MECNLHGRTASHATRRRKASMHQTQPQTPPPAAAATQAGASRPPAGGTQRIVKIRRDYNAWVGDETLEDYALRFTPRAFRRWSEFRVANTAIGAVSFLVLEAIGGALVVNYGFTNAICAILAVSLLIFLTGIPISYYAARNGVDMDLLTRGAGFGYLGSTLTSLIYAVFTFVFFALEAAIMSLALELYLKVPLSVAYVISALVIIPVVTFGITFINRLQGWTQPLWLVLLVVPYVVVLWREPHVLAEWVTFSGVSGNGHEFNLVAFGAGCTVVFSLIVQIGEQVDYLRFLPPRTRANRFRWWAALIAAGPGWIVPGAMKMLGGAFLAFLAIQHEIDPVKAVEPTQMYLVAYHYVFHSPEGALAAMTLFVIVSQLKINVTNAYAGSLAWSNFFARLTHSHPGRVVWLVFNVLIALLLVEMGVFEAISKVLALYANVAIAWIGAVVGDLVINKPLGYSPRHVEFKRAHLYDVNPVGVGAMLIASLIAALSHAGVFGTTAEALSSFIALLVAFVCAPLLAIATRGRFYLARDGRDLEEGAILRCVICENTFEREDMAHCPAYAGSICSLCCSLDSRCNDSCKPHARLPAQFGKSMRTLFPRLTLGPAGLRLAQYAGLLIAVVTLLGGVLAVQWYQSVRTLPNLDTTVHDVLLQGYLKAFFALALVGCIAAWWLVLANENRKVTQEESQRQAELLMQEIEAHRKTDAALQRASAAAESANRAKSRYVTGLSHELRTPLNSILGYAQLLLQGTDELPPARRNAVATIYRSGEHLLALVDGLLDVARIEAGKLQLNVTEISLPDFVAQLAAMLEPQATDKGLQFEFQTSGRMADVVRIDEKRVRQILINLIGNAIRFTSHGSVKVRASYAWEAITFEIADTGPGMPASELERLFLPFERGAAAREHDHGAGLGLTICRLLTELMGGNLEVQSEVGKGTRFIVKLFAPEVRAPQLLASGPLNVKGYDGPRRTVLVVDDLAEQRRIVVQTLAPLGFNVVEAASGPEALQWLGTASADLIVMDVSMPDMDGFEASRLIRDNHLSAAPVLILSANAFADDRDKGAAAGCDDYLAKPLYIPLLLDKLAALLQLHWIVEPTEAAAASAVARVDVTASLPATLREKLRAQLEMGYVQGFIEQLDAAEHGAPELAAVLEPLRALARRFRLTELAHLLAPTPQVHPDA
ncbi:response regulator [Paraburkholderia xenovorans]|jgi:signal transduction histidine kinase/purine-cytosine permease-like protein/DNA-binding NarL/FixJ family response regulator|nr:ATP-binding protein [Paraburkholderia xenovorans]NPT36983.1 response regulator [Paraburkholderia xenovorans]